MLELIQSQDRAPSQRKNEENSFKPKEDSVDLGVAVLLDVTNTPENRHYPNVEECFSKLHCKTITTKVTTERSMIALSRTSLPWIERTTSMILERVTAMLRMCLQLM